MAWIIKKISIRFAMFIPFLIFLVFIILYWETTESSVLYGLYIVYFAVILNNWIVILRNKKKLDVARRNSVDIS
jgi:fucose permease